MTPHSIGGDLDARPVIARAGPHRTRADGVLDYLCTPLNWIIRPLARAELHRERSPVHQRPNGTYERPSAGCQLRLDAVNLRRQGSALKKRHPSVGTECAKPRKR